MTPTLTDFDDISRRINATATRNCAKCGKPFLALGLQGICDTCAEAIDAPRVIVRELGESWPERHRAKLADMAGPSLERARKLLPLAMSGGMIVLAGDRGRGKTQMATWLAWQRGKAGKKPGIYAKAFDLFAAVKGTWGRNATEAEGKALARFKQASFLALDECHERGETDWENRTLRNVLDHRYDACLPTLLIGNWPTAEDIGASLGASITDRITETGGVVWCRWESYRAA
jgi:DNA replication protein DnaC